MPSDPLKRSRKIWISFILLGYCSASLSAAPESLQAFTQEHCITCHDAETKKGGLDLTALKPDFGHAQTFSRWVQIHDRVANGEMPPKKKTPPPADERSAFVEALHQELHAVSLASQRTNGRVVVRRLNLTEYETSLRDLLGKQVDVKDLLPPDPIAAGFDKLSAVLDTSAVHLLRYQDAAEQALKTVIPRKVPEEIKLRLSGREIVAKSKHADLEHSLRVEGDTLFIYARPYDHIVLGSAAVPQPGRYVLRASIHAVGSGDRPLPVRFSVGKPWGRRKGSVLAVRDAPAGKPTVIELECELERGDLVDALAWSLPTQRHFKDRKMNEGKPLEEYAGPGIALHWMEIEGPLDVFPPKGHTNLFGDLPLKSKYKGADFYVESSDPKADARRLLATFLPLAFRRPVDAELQNYYVKIATDAFDEKRPFQDAMLLAYQAVLCSPNFLFLTEPLGTREGHPAALDDYAVAARLSYFLWSTFPDMELMQLAAEGELSRPDVLRTQVERLLTDSRAQRFIEHFAGQWLDLRKINDTVPSPQLYGEFDDFLFWAMPEETRMFFEEVLVHDRSLLDFTHSNWTVLNQRLAQHYGIPGVFGGEMRIVQLPPDSHRGGVLTQASILKITADGTKTSPILRGKWVLDKLVGRPPPPPPPNVPGVEPDIRGATTIRQQLDKHRNIESCAACHRHIDPPGFALEAFDVIGGWRDFYRSTVHKRDAVVPLANYPGRTIVRGPDVEMNGETANGEAFINIDDYRKILLADPDQLARNLVEKLLVYGTGAEIQYADREVVEQLVAKSRAQKFGFRSLLHEVVQSRVFLSK
ncbi:MAG: hypothetical protein ACI9QL_001417 [Candidatus Omnitrophota bacterium]